LKVETKQKQKRTETRLPFGQRQHHGRMTLTLTP